MEAFESNIAGTESSVCADEERAVSFVNECLSGGYDEEGIARWWQRPRTQLDDLTPQQLPDRWRKADQFQVGTI
jgi:hypothetical protein